MCAKLGENSVVIAVCLMTALDLLERTVRWEFSQLLLEPSKGMEIISSLSVCLFVSLSVRKSVGLWGELINH